MKKNSKAPSKFQSLAFSDTNAAFSLQFTKIQREDLLRGSAEVKKIANPIPLVPNGLPHKTG